MFSDRQVSGVKLYFNCKTLFDAYIYMFINNKVAAPALSFYAHEGYFGRNKVMDSDAEPKIGDISGVILFFLPHCELRQHE